jgi:para-aminobenzoate synthetase / 4-amino-4-deoxychorismate lyase
MSPLDVLALLRNDAHPFALIGAWAGGGAVLGSEPVAVASPPQRLANVLGPGHGLRPGYGLGPGHGLGAGPAAFGGGWIGYLGYGAATDTAQVGQPAPTDPPAQQGPPAPARPPAPGAERLLPLWWFGYYDHVLVQEQPSGRWFFEGLVTPQRAAEIDERCRGLADRIRRHRPDAHPYSCGEFTVTPAPEGHIDAVTNAVGLIHRGDMFQANITLRLDADFTGDPLDLFCHGAQALRPPYAAFLRLTEGAIASFSPELFLRRTARQVLTSPIKGTSRRSADPARAAMEKRELASSAKNRAENVMIVDLMRSDLSAVCRPGSVTVPRLAAVEPHPGIWHLVSDVRGELGEGRTDADLVSAAFPPGSVTGAPKVRAMEVIGELEVTPREVYTGAIGYRSAVAGLELSVAIRTFEFAAGRVWLGAGGGIVADSVPAAEFTECLLKSRPLIEAVGGRLGSEEGPDGPRASAGAGPLTLRPRPAAGVFTSLRVTGGVADGLGEHLDRLAASAWSLYGKELPPGLAGQLAQCLAAGGSGRLRITVRPVGGPLQCRVELADPGPDPGAIRLRTAEVAGGLGGHKWADRRLLADRIAALSPAPDEQLLLTDADGSVLETDRANIFAVLGGVLHTPAADGRILPGIARARVLAAARRAGLAVRVGPVQMAELAGASEVFVTNSVRGILPVVALRDPPAHWLRGPVADILRAAPQPSERERAAPASGRPRPARAVPSYGVPGGPLIALLDNYDSFTYNLAHLLQAAGCQVEVIRNDEMTAAEVAGLGAAGVVISPGPCAPAEAGICVDLIRALGGATALLGVCLGHQAIAVAYGGAIEQVAPVHGKASRIEHDGRGIFAGLPAGFAAARYHSLLVAEPGLPECLAVSARTADGLPMAIRHRSHPVDGVQFHPESILTGCGSRLIGNFLQGMRERPRT